MLLHSKPMLLAAMLCWVAPLSAQRPAEKPVQRVPADCPAERANATPRVTAPVVLVPRSDFLGVAPSSENARAVFLP